MRLLLDFFLRFLSDRGVQVTILANASRDERAEELKVLFTGDEDTTGYAHPSIVFEFCRVKTPLNETFVWKQFYGERDPGDFDKIVKDSVEQGFKMWVDAGRPRL